MIPYPLTTSTMIKREDTVSSHKYRDHILSQKQKGQIERILYPIEIIKGEYTVSSHKYGFFLLFLPTVW
jgi:hypothetical protein